MHNFYRNVFWKYFDGRYREAERCFLCGSVGMFISTFIFNLSFNFSFLKGFVLIRFGSNEVRHCIQIISTKYSLSFTFQPFRLHNSTSSCNFHFRKFYFLSSMYLGRMEVSFRSYIQVKYLLSNFHLDMHERRVLVYFYNFLSTALHF